MEKHHYQSSMGFIEITTSGGAISSLVFIKEPEKRVQSKDAVIKQCCKELDEYFRDKRKEFKVPFHVKGTTFQEKVWKELLKIPYGKTISYAILAEKAENPKAYRAAGTANGKNPIAIIIPCHRVINAGGGLGGYAYGLEIKRQLLNLEK